MDHTHMNSRPAHCCALCGRCWSFCRIISRGTEEGGEGQEQEVCTICFDSPPTAQLCHADGQSCQCCCGDCGDRLKAEDRPCPMCRKEIVLVVKQSFKYSVTAMT